MECSYKRNGREETCRKYFGDRIERVRIQECLKNFILGIEAMPLRVVRKSVVGATLNYQPVGND